MEDSPSSVPGKWRGWRVGGAVSILLGIATGIVATQIGVGLLWILLWCASLGLLCLGFGLLSVYRHTVVVVRQPGDLTGQAEASCGVFGQDGGHPGTPPLSQEVEKRIALLFEPVHQEMVRTILLRDCGNNLWRTAKETEMDRLRFAVLKVSRGSLDRLTDAIKLAKTDWRDVLSAAGFAWNPKKHRSWLPRKNW